MGGNLAALVGGLHGFQALVWVPDGGPRGPGGLLGLRAGARLGAGLKVFETLDGARKEGLDTAPYHVDQLKTLQSKLAQQSAALKEKVWPRPSLTGDQKEALAEQTIDTQAR